LSNLTDRTDLYTELQGPGLCFAVVNDGQIVEMKSGGYANIEKKIPIDANTVFNIASNSKAFTAAAILLLERQKLCDLNESLSKYLPELPAFASAVKVKHLIHHTSGLPHYVPLYYSSTPVTNREVMNFLCQVKNLAFPAGARIEYCNTGYVLLAEILQRVTGREFPEIIHDYIFKPLAMTQSWVVNLARGHSEDNRALGYDAWPVFAKNDRSVVDYVFGDGGFMTSMNDYIKWVRALSKPGFFSAEELRRLFSPGVSDSGEPWIYESQAASFSIDTLRDLVNTDGLVDEARSHYGFGWILSSVRGIPMVTHGGYWCGFRSVVARARENVWLLAFSNYAGILREEILAELLRKHVFMLTDKNRSFQP
jgi:CubicO group peptidase (beta-lactamase class C family)